jgi:hypothetical protein
MHYPHLSETLCDRVIGCIHKSEPIIQACCIGKENKRKNKDGLPKNCGTPTWVMQGRDKPLV